MLLAVISSLIMIHSREIKLNGIIPDLIKVFWKIMELRVLVLFSFLLQVFLILFGNRRKYTTNRWLQIGVWWTYLSAGWVATYALSILSKDSKNPSMQPNFIIWAPFLLLHLGGPDTITAYSPEDNELWLRHLFGLISQLIVAAPVVQISFKSGNLFYVTIPVMVAGIIKYGERTWSLWLGSTKKFEESILPPPDPGPNYAYFSHDLAEKIAEGYKVRLMVESTPVSFYHSQIVIANESIQDAFFLQYGFYLFRIFQFLFADLILSIQDHHNSQYFFQSIQWNDAFKVIEVELGLMYDKLYTKAVATYSCLGISLKCVSFLCTLSAFVSFYCLIDDKGHIDYDKTITLVLFVGAILFEIYAVVVLLSSSWGMLWLSNHRNWRVDLIYRFISRLQTPLKLSHTNRWSNLVSQFNLINFCLKDDKPFKCPKIKKLRRFHQFLRKAFYRDKQPVSGELKELIFKKLREKSWSAKEIKACKKLCAYRGDGVLHRWKCHSIYWSTKVEFDQSLLIWHIATDLCHYSDVTAESSPTVKTNYETSKLLSDYMLYLLVKCPFMLPNGIGQMRFEDTCAEIGELQETERDELCKWILEVGTDVEPSAIKGERSKSVVFESSRLAKSLESLAMEKNWSKERKSEIIRDVWVEMVCHAASQCSGLHHRKQLSRGGELLTHVWLLMAHLGITEQFQISQGRHERTRVIFT
ncbi:hypothetical protein VNO80_15823 [Phaseolus coccineus]|uniref:DUF4220 domain-containing protein n=1 Tax=Phaseolus coccineus TaxID=3886 RepID=A0AAN9MKZ0_PHACN